MLDLSVSPKLKCTVLKYMNIKHVNYCVAFLEPFNLFCRITLYRKFDIVVYMYTCKPQTLILKCCSCCVMSNQSQYCVFNETEKIM